VDSPSTFVVFCEEAAPEEGESILAVSVDVRFGDKGLDAEATGFRFGIRKGEGTISSLCGVFSID